MLRTRLMGFVPLPLRDVRALQRGKVVLKVSGRPTDLPNVIRAAGEATVVSRADQPSEEALIGYML